MRLKDRWATGDITNALRCVRDMSHFLVSVPAYNISDENGSSCKMGLRTVSPPSNTIRIDRVL